LRVVREGKDKGQGVGYLNDGTMVVINNAQSMIGQQVTVKVISLFANRRRHHYLCRFDNDRWRPDPSRPGYFFYGICNRFSAPLIPPPAELVRSRLRGQQIFGQCEK